MFIRWKRKLLTQTHPLECMRYSLYAVIVESYRQAGKPRQRNVKYLGYIPEGDLEDKNERLRFWSQVDRQLADFEPETRDYLETALQKKVARP
jgi:hypothetical protein